jgi:hypothetical protein
MKALRMFIAAILLGLAPASAFAQAQAETPRPFAWEVARGVLIDPTTYAPALISYEAIRQDWKTSQVLFAHGWLEENPRFTVSGRANDVPVGYGEGMSRIRRTSLTTLQYSAVNNVSARVVARLLVARYPHRKRLIRALSWAERIAFASFLTYSNSVDHIRQASINRRLAREYGYYPPVRSAP